MPIAIPALGAFAVALLGLLLLLAFVLLGEFLKEVLDITIPLIGNLGTIARSIVRGAISRLGSMLLTTVHELGAFWTMLWTHHSTNIVHAQSHAQATVNRLGAVVRSTLPRVAHNANVAAQEYAYSAAVNAQHTVERELAHDSAVLSGEVYAETVQRMQQAQVISDALRAETLTREHQVAAVAGGLQNEVDQLARSTSAAIAAAESLTVHDVAAVRSELLTDLGDVERWVETVAAQLGTYAESAATSAERAAIDYTNQQAKAAAVTLWPAVAGPAERAQQGVAAETAGALSGVPAITAAPPADLAAVLSQTMAMAATAVAYVDECGLSLCRGLGTLATLLNALAESGLVAAIVALAALTATDPGGAATVLHDVAAGPVDAARAAAQALTGL